MAASSRTTIRAHKRPRSSSSPAPVLHFDNTLGALLIGGLVAIALWGIICVQTFNFFSRGSRDSPIFKLLIVFLWALDTLDSVLNGHILYYYLVTNYTHPAAIFTPVWSVVLHVAVTSICDFVVRSMFARRVYKLSNGNIYFTTWIVAISLTDLICGLVITVKAWGIASYLDLNTLSTLMYLNFAAGTTSDASVAIFLCYYLRKSRTGFRRTDSLIRILMMYTINTGAIVALDASLGLITYVVMPLNFIFLAFYLLLSKLYLNSYLAALNARQSLREKGEDHPVSIHLSRITQSHDRYGPPTDLIMPVVVEKQQSRTETLAISVQTMVDQKLDDGPRAY